MFKIKRIRSLVLAFWVLASGVYGHSLAAVEVTPEQQEAGLVVSRYMQGLVDGDTQQLKACLSQELWADRKDYIETTGYGDLLRRQYQGAAFQIAEYQTVSDMEVEATVRLRFSSGHEKTMKFLLRSDPSLPYPGFRIAEEII